MLKIRRAEERGRYRNDWLDSHHSFSFGEYHDPQHMGWSILRVINDDRIAPGGGFPTHPHRDMEIVTYVLEGALAHRDSTGGGSVIRPGDVQRMSAGSGIAHSEFNHSDVAPVHLLQIWLLPNRRGVTPGYDQKSFPAAERRGRLRLVVSPDGSDGSIAAHQDGRVYAGVLGVGDEARHQLSPDRVGWVQVARGGVNVNGQDLETGDGAAVAAGSALVLAGRDDGEVLLFDLPAA